MSQDVVADALNKIMNGKRSRKEFIVVTRFSKLLLEVLEIGKKEGYIKDYKVDKKELKIEIGELNECRAIKPRFSVTKNDILKYMKRFLPAKDMGIMIISTSKGLMTQNKAINNSIGGCLIAYFY